ncbi:hypothetical protein ACWDFR_27530 [Streptomyces sp. 900105755]|uniref:hypothetical protein n=1 Tax=Streptomyces sp. NPDC001507 TaxID=3364579 RepID=UPI00369A6457
MAAHRHQRHHALPDRHHNLALKSQNLGDDVNLKMYWDGGHGANEDPGDLIRWMGEITGYTAG